MLSRLLARVVVEAVLEAALHLDAAAPVVEHGFEFRGPTSVTYQLAPPRAIRLMCGRSG